MILSNSPGLGSRGILTDWATHTPPAAERAPALRARQPRGQPPSPGTAPTPGDSPPPQGQPPSRGSSAPQQANRGLPSSPALQPQQGAQHRDTTRAPGHPDSLGRGLQAAPSTTPRQPRMGFAKGSAHAMGEYQQNQRAMVKYHQNQCTTVKYQQNQPLG